MITVQQLVNKNLNRIEPVHQLRLATIRNTLIIISLAEIPHADLVKVM